MPGYHLNPDRRCPTCTYYGHDFRHLKACVPRKYWPAEAIPDFAVSGSTNTDAGGASVTVLAPAPPEPRGKHSVVCDCGFVAKNAQALRMHRMKAKQHQRVPLPNGEFLPEAM